MSAALDLDSLISEQETKKRAAALAAWNLLGIKQLAEELPPVPWLCESLRLAPGAVTLVAGYGYSRKTMALQSLAVSVASGEDVWGVFKCKKGRVVHLDYEQGRRLTQERYQRLCRGMGFDIRDLPDGSLSVACMPRLYLETQQAIDSLMPIVEGAALVIVDSMRAAFPHADENSSEVRSYLDALNHVSERTEAMMGVIHHARKPQTNEAGTATHAIRGSSALFDACQTVYVFAGEKGKPTVVHHQKDRIRGAELPDFGIMGEDVPGPRGSQHGLRVVHLEGEQLREAEDQQARFRAEQAATKVRDRILSLVRSKGRYAGSLELLAEELKVRKQTVTSVANELLESGELLKKGTYHRPVWEVR